MASHGTHGRQTPLTASVHRYLCWPHVRADERGDKR
jgi:hypothetical protein